jgi:hypothetical protein
MAESQTRTQADDEGVVKIELKHMPFYGGCLVLFLQFTNPNFLNDIVNTYATNVVYVVLIVAGFAYLQGLQYFHALFNTQKNDIPHESALPQGTQMMEFFDGHIRVVLLVQKTMVIREVHRQILLLGDGLAQEEEEEEPPARRRTSGGGGRGTRGGRGTARQNTHNQVDAQLVMRLVVSSVEPDKQHWSYWLSNFGYETRKIEKVKYDQKCTL